MCGSSKQEQITQQEQEGLSNLMLEDFRSRFGQQQATIDQLTASLQPTLDAGPDQPGMGANELTAANTAIITGTGQNYANAKAALQTTLSARGGGNVPAEVQGAEVQAQGALAAKAAGQESAEQLALTEQNYALGRQKYNAAVAGEMALGGMENPLQFGSQASEGFGQSFKEANAINQENNQATAEIVSGAVGLGTDIATFGAAGGFTDPMAGLKGVTGQG